MDKAITMETEVCLASR